MIFHVVKQIPVKYPFYRYTYSAGTTFSHGINWASEASPTLGCSIEISRDIYIQRIHVPFESLTFSVARELKLRDGFH